MSEKTFEEELIEIGMIAGKLPDETTKQAVERAVARRGAESPDWDWAHSRIVALLNENAAKQRRIAELESKLNEPREAGEDGG
jgi:hypothetical protein